ncbi:MAG: polysaccharide biosynthesis C-terminal domain-containing protein [Clostridia bacterium]|nr:polysaccharide biosynthesis C-terminal domain-containing protein [Clostridia bacterium]
MKKHAKQIFWNASLLTAASLLMRTVGVWFQVYVSNRAGAEAMGLFSLISGVYGFALTLATSGIQLGVTRVITEAIGKNRPERVPYAMRHAVGYALCFGVGSALLILGFARPIGLYWLKDERTVSSLRLFGISLPLIALSAVFNGYFTAVRRPYKNAASQVFEQLVKIGASMYLLAILLPGGIERTCCALVLGGSLAEIASFLFGLLLYRADRKRYRLPKIACNGSEERKSLIRISLPIAFTAYLRSGLLTLQHILIPEGLRNSGASHASALISYGTITGMALPVILYPAALIASFSGLLIPEMAECRVQNSPRRISYMISRVWSLALLFSIGTAGILICFSNEIGTALYPGTAAGHYVQILAPLIPIMYVDTATDAMMKGLGEEVFSMNVNVADALLSVILVWILVPRFGISGYLFSIYFSELFNTVLSIHHLLLISHTPVRLFKWVYKPLLCIVGATTAVRAILEVTGFYIANTALSILLHVLSVVLLYLLLLRLTGAVDREDVAWTRALFRVREK